MLSARFSRSVRPTLVLSARRPQPHHAFRVNRPRTFASSPLNTLSEGFLDLALAIPFPEYIPPYSGTIILVTVISRLVFTVPFSIWAKRRQWRAEDFVVPQLQEEKPKLLKKILADMHTDGFRGNKEQAKAEFEKRAKVVLTTRRSELFAKHHCSPTPTMVIPVVSQLPLFVGFSMLLSRMSQYPTVFDSESFLTLTSLSHSDPTVTLPIVLGIVTLANVETSRWFVNAEVLEREKKVAEWNTKKRAMGHTVLEPKKIIQTAMRGLSVGRILIAAMVPGSIQLYWVTSAVFGLVQTWVLDYWDSRRRRMKVLALETTTAGASHSQGRSS
ncbi:hypothetical protein K474DRAFT_1586995 [Panus rudis PR-1116 ss-1]|nr:hypothetical protein K474DRAFT_1586995 [Panus rudis PR-1116 ss-1]